MDKCTKYMLDHGNCGVSCRELATHFNLPINTVTGYLSVLKHRGVVKNAYQKWYYCKNVVELDNHEIEITFHNGDVEIWG